MRVLVDALPLLGHATIGAYLRELLFHLRRESSDHEYCLFFRAFRNGTYRQALGLAGEAPFAGFETRMTRVPDRFLEWCWTRRSLHVPFTERWLGNPDLFLATVHLTPLLRGPAAVLIAYDLIPLRFPALYGAVDPLLPLRIRRSLDRAAAVIAISESTKRDYVELLGADAARIHVVYPGVGARFSASVDRTERDRTLARHRVRPPYVLYVGVLAPHKNVERLIAVFRRLKDRRRLPHQLVLCGRAAWGGAILESADDLIATGDCVVLDHVPAADVPHLYHGAEAFAFLSLYEGFGLPPLEAMACGVPVVVSSAASLPEVVGDAAVQVDPRDEAAIEAALYRVLSDEGMRNDLRARGLQQAARFRWSETARQTLRVFAAARASV